MTIININMNIFISKLKLQLAQNLEEKKIFSTTFIDENNTKNYTKGKNFKKAAVLCLLDYKKNTLNIILTLRSKNLKDHPGQVSFPGGKANKNEDLVKCALRETEEEIGLKKKNINVLGQMNMYLSGSNFLIKPVIAITKGSYELRINKEEVERVINLPVNFFFEKKNLTKNTYFSNNNNIMMYYYDMYWKNIRIWGTTAIILVHLVNIINRVINKC